MFNFTYHNPTRIVFGQGQIKKLAKLIPTEKNILLTYGGGSIKKNGVYDQVMTALAGHRVTEFGGIEPNPTYETLSKAITLAQKNDINFLLSVGGGSVLDGTKFIAAGVPLTNQDPWDIISKHLKITTALPIGCVLTLPATGSESNCGAVISKKATHEKQVFSSPLVFPQFSILDPETTFSLPKHQLANGIIDSFVHVLEQYLTFDCDTPLQDRQAEAVLSTLVEQAPAVLQEPPAYAARANFMWCATRALNGLINCGVAEDWATHLIGHELTALYGIDHAQSLAIVGPRLFEYKFQKKLNKLAQYGNRVWGLDSKNREACARQAIAKTEEFFQSLGTQTHLSDYNISAQEAASKCKQRFTLRGFKLGENKDITPDDVEKIILACV